ncbi:MAG: sugar-binding transcriptional regulator [Clostridiaceae bacterium]|nr:sugar-binding transcriptional regulator [Clostridiaceae bacterium]
MNSKKQLMVDVSKMYYNHGMSQKEIAAELGISRGYVCQLMDLARKEGIVEIKVNDLYDSDTDLERHVKELFGLEMAKIVEIKHLKNKSFLTAEVIKEANSYIETIIKSNMIVAYTWGSTIYEISTKMRKRTDIRNVTSIQLCGGTTNLEKRIYTSEISTNIAAAYNGTPLYIPLPVLVQNADIKRAIYSDKNMSSTLNVCKAADVALFTVGSFGEENILYRGGYIDSESIRRLIKKNAAGDLCAHFIDQHGEVCDKELDDRTISIDLNDFARIKQKVCIAMGPNKVKTLLGVLRKRYVNALITDEETMLSVLKLI